MENIIETNWIFENNIFLVSLRDGNINLDKNQKLYQGYCQCLNFIDQYLSLALFKLDDFVSRKLLLGIIIEYQKYLDSFVDFTNKKNITNELSNANTAFLSSLKLRTKENLYLHLGIIICIDHYLDKISNFLANYDNEYPKYNSNYNMLFELQKKVCDNDFENYLKIANPIVNRLFDDYYTTIYYQNCIKPITLTLDIQVETNGCFKRN